MAGRGSAGNVLAALASAIVPGLGQLAQGRLGPAFGFFLLAVFGLVLWAVFGALAAPALLGFALWAALDAARWEPWMDSRPVGAAHGVPAPVERRRGDYFIGAIAAVFALVVGFGWLGSREAEPLRAAYVAVGDCETVDISWVAPAGGFRDATAARGESWRLDFADWPRARPMAVRAQCLDGEPGQVRVEIVGAGATKATGERYSRGEIADARWKP